jgi:hypothetical protein
MRRERVNPVWAHHDVSGAQLIPELANGFDANHSAVPPRYVDFLAHDYEVLPGSMDLFDPY